MPTHTNGLIIPIFATNIRNVADAMLERHGHDAEREAERLAGACQARSDQAGCVTWWRIAASIRDVVGFAPSGQLN